MSKGSRRTPDLSHLSLREEQISDSTLVENLDRMPVPPRRVIHLAGIAETLIATLVTPVHDWITAHV